MKAFLSHSSKDKHFVGAVYKVLGPTQSEYDEKTFTYTMNVRAIREALERSDLFVMFLSANSITSSFVSEEQRTALELRGNGFIKRVIVFALDDTSYRALPDWMRKTNVVQRISSPKSCARRIQSLIWAITVEEHQEDSLYIGREDDRGVIRRVLSLPPAQTPIALHMVGFFGVGRRTLLKNSMKEFLPRVADLFVEVTSGKFEGPEELYRQLYELHRVSSRTQKVNDLDNFSQMTLETQSLVIVQVLKELRSDSTLVIIVDEGGVYDDDGDYQSHFKKILLAMSDAGQPALGFIQTRMMPFQLRNEYQKTFHHSVRPLSEESTRDLLGLSLKRIGVDYTSKDVSDICEHLDGHPFNVRFAVNFIKSYGVASLTHDPSGLVEWKNKRAEDFLSKIDFGRLESDILACLGDYVYLSSEAIYSILDVRQEQIAASLRILEDFCCIERREGYFHISRPLRGAVRKDRRFDRSAEWKKNVAINIVNVVSEYEDADQMPISIIESATVAALHGAKAPPFIERLILPSHLLKMAGEQYGKHRYGAALKFTEDALNMGDRLTVEGKVEALRLLGLAGVRISNDDAFNRSVQGLAAMGNVRSAKRNMHFLRGFRSRVRGRLDEAEGHFLSAWQQGRENQSTNRELASLYCKQQMYAEAEGYAKAALRLQPTNPYILDILAEALIGRQEMGESIDLAELGRVIEDLRVHGDAPGLAFYLIRQAHMLAREGKNVKALTTLDRACEKDKGLVAPYFVRADINLKMNNLQGAEGDVAKIETILESAGGFSREEEARLDELKARILIEKGHFVIAKETIARSAFMTGRMRERANRGLAKCLRSSDAKALSDLKAWADEVLSPKPASGAKRFSPRRRK